MELRPGFKQTELGPVPKEWSLCEIGDLDPYVTSGSRGWARYYSDHGSAFLRITNLSRQSIYPDLSDLRFVKIPLNDTEGRRTQLHGGDLLVSITADIGIVGYVGRSVPTPTYINQHIALVRFDPNRIRSQFLCYFLASEMPQRLFRAMTDQGAKAGMSLTGVKKIKAVLPPLPEQEAIAEALSDADALIESLEQLIAKKRQIKQGAMQQLLTGKKRLPGFTGEWVVKALGEIGDSLIGLTYAPRDVRANGVLVLRSSNIFEGTLRFEDAVYVEMDIPERIMVRQGDILICVRNGSRDLIGKCARIDERARGMTFGAFMAVFRTPYHGFVYHQFQSDLIKRQIREHLGATINQITNKSLNSFRVPFPLDVDEQVAIASVLNGMDAENGALEQRLLKARQIKVALMQELLTGRIRLV